MIRAFIIFVLFLTYSTLAAQAESDFQFFLDVDRPILNEVKKEISQDQNELELSLSILFGVYQNFISSQDGSTCSFYPSCSKYCQHAIRHNGLILGGIQGLDRLVRCNGLSPNKYELDLKRRKLIDHVK